MPAVNAQPAASNPIEMGYEWFKSLPIITRTLFGLTVGVSLVGNLGFVSPYTFLLVFDKVYNEFQVSFMLSHNIHTERSSFIRPQFWRLITCFFFNKFGFNFLMTLFFLYQNSISLEQGIFANRTADYAFFVITSMLLIDV
jgi:derlin-1